MAYETVVHELAVEELASLRPFDQRRIITEIREQLTNHPGIPTRRRKCLVEVLVGIEDYDAEDVRLASSADFWQLIRSRRTSGKSIPLSEVETRLATARRKPISKRAATKKAKKGS